MVNKWLERKFLRWLVGNLETEMALWLTDRRSSNVETTQAEAMDFVKQHLLKLNLMRYYPRFMFFWKHDCGRKLSGATIQILEKA